MSAERRSNLKLVTPRDLPAPDPVEDARDHAVTGTSLAAAVAVALIVVGVSYGFFDWAPVWVHAVAFFVAFGIMLAFGPRLARTG
ncbi:hypothetical protein [Aquabacter cavernae]|uniref:hypothetical protein n=1 Tax=Aquabacter cavernae TaxID=2496029 RepID=UPI000F8D56BE|nr:hypothetical protein [Aquabacter cavernae]